MLYHLGRGLWKSVPVLGPIVEEVFYEQFREELKGRVNGMSSHQLDEIMAHLPTVGELEELDQRMSDLSEEERLLAMRMHANVIEEFSLVREEMQSGFTSVRELVEDLKGELAESDELRTVLQVVEQRRKEWASRISKNQKKLLVEIPTEYVSLDDLWKVTQRLILNCGYKEYRFRLHEFEWLGLVERKRVHGTWHYRRRENLDEP